MAGADQPDPLNSVVRSGGAASIPTSAETARSVVRSYPSLAKPRRDENVGAGLGGIARL
jgi:hypothetical protein